MQLIAFIVLVPTALLVVIVVMLKSISDQIADVVEHLEKRKPDDD
jgi:hypothetical protein